jgi:hypothetical protein
MNALDKERLDVLAGVRSPSAKDGAAVRRRDVASLVSLPKATAKAVPPDGTVTPEMFNALLADFVSLRQAIDEIAAKVK